jgi:hypothetical protein
MPTQDGAVVASTSGGAGRGGLTTSDVNALITTALATERATYLALGAGLPCSLAAATVTGDGSERYLALSLPSGIVATGRRVRVSGTATMRDARDGALLATRSIVGCELVKLASSPWWEEVAAGVSTPDEDAASIGDWLADPAHAPGIGWRDDTGELAIAYQVRADAPADCTFAFRGTLTNVTGL